MQHLFSFRKQKQRKRISVPEPTPVPRSAKETEAGTSWPPEKLVVLRNGNISFGMDDLWRASSKLLGKGSIGTSSKAVLKEGTAVAVKLILEYVVVTESEFDLQMEVLGEIRHENIAPLKAYLFSQYMLISDYMACGSVASLLHGNGDDRGSSPIKLDWDVRKKIALSTAKGIAHLHISSKLVHGNIKSSNLLLRPDHDVSLSDFGLNPLFGSCIPPNKVAGYCAPEILDNQNVTFQSDVYSLGILLLELLTGKSPNQLSLARWVQSVVREEWIPKVFDSELTRYNNTGEEMVLLLRIATSCVSYVPEQRPNIQQVVCLIQNLFEGETSDGLSYNVTLKATGARNSSSIDDVNVNKSVYFGNNSISIDLEDLMGSSNGVLGIGSVGMSFKAGLKDGTVVVVKRLKDVVVTKWNFDSQIKVLMNIKHDNVVPLKAYYFSEDEKLLISNHMTCGSLSSLLHGCQGSGQVSLDWKNRRKIALSAAKGIEHLHIAGKLVHGDIKSSNILFSRDQEVSLSDFGLNKLFGSAAPPNQDAGYSAPEIIETKKVTFQSDVYSLGIVLLELLTGKAPNQVSLGEGTINLPTWVRSVNREEWTCKVFDAELKRDSNIDREMVTLLQIAMACVSYVPDQRPEIQ